MGIMVDLPPAVEAILAIKARVKGVPIGEFVRDYLVEHVLPVRPEDLTPEELDAAFEEIADMIPQDQVPLSDAAISREAIYTREDEMR